MGIECKLKKPVTQLQETDRRENGSGGEREVRSRNLGRPAASVSSYLIVGATFFRQTSAGRLEASVPTGEASQLVFHRLRRLSVGLSFAFPLLFLFNFCRPLVSTTISRSLPGYHYP